MAVLTTHNNENPTSFLIPSKCAIPVPISSPAAYAKCLLRLSRESPRQKRLVAIKNAETLITSAIEDLVKAKQALTEKCGLMASMATAGKVALRKTALKKGGPTMGEALHLESDKTRTLVQKALEKYHEAKAEVQVLPCLCLANGFLLNSSTDKVRGVNDEPPSPRHTSKKSYLRYTDNLLASMHELKTQLQAMEQVYS